MFDWIEFCVRKALFWFWHSMCFAILVARNAHAQLEWGKMNSRSNERNDDREHKNPTPLSAELRYKHYSCEIGG